jgi:abortive infection bacteriophage resistance protein
MVESFKHKSYKEQADLLESRGIVFSGDKSRSKAEHSLSVISYYKIKKYKRRTNDRRVNSSTTS